MLLEKMMKVGNDKTQIEGVLSELEEETGKQFADITMGELQSYMIPRMQEEAKLIDEKITTNNIFFDKLVELLAQYDKTNGIPEAVILANYIVNQIGVYDHINKLREEQK